MLYIIIDFTVHSTNFSPYVSSSRSQHLAGELKPLKSLGSVLDQRKIFVLHVHSVPELQFPCVSCGKVYKSKAAWYRHSHNECGREPNICCTQCDYRTYQRSHLRRHMLGRHNLVLPSGQAGRRSEPLLQLLR